MIFTEREKLIYTAPDGSRYDPVSLHHRLVLASEGKLENYLNQWWAEESSEIEKAQAAVVLAGVARRAMGVPAFDEEGGKLDAVVLETLYNFLEWLEGKD